jgi:hypothetical protein
MAQLNGVRNVPAFGSMSERVMTRRTAALRQSNVLRDASGPRITIRSTSSCVELGGARALMRRHGLRMLQRAAVGEIRRDPGRPERVVADQRHDAGGERALAYHAPYVDPHRVGSIDAITVPPCGGILQLPVARGIAFRIL